MRERNYLPAHMPVTMIPRQAGHESGARMYLLHVHTAEGGHSPGGSVELERYKTACSCILNRLVQLHHHLARAPRLIRRRRGKCHVRGQGCALLGTAGHQRAVQQAGLPAEVPKAQRDV